MDNKYVLETLRELIAARLDCERGFALCAEHARDAALRRTCMLQAHECRAAWRELEDCARRLGANGSNQPPPLLAFRPDVDRWTAVIWAEDREILEECESGAGRLLQAYRNALDDPLPDELREVVLRQFEGAVNYHDQVRELAARHLIPTAAGVQASAPAGLE